MIYILDKSEEIIGVLSNDNPNTCPYYDDLLKESLEDFRLTYEFKVPSNHEIVELIEEGGYFIRKGLDGELLMFRIKIAEEDHSDSNLKYIYGESVGLELLYTTIRPTNQNALSAENALSYILAESRWSVGIVEVAGTTNLVYEDYATSLQRLQELAKTFSGELRFRVEIDGSKVTARYVDLLERRGADTGKRFTYSKDIKSIKRTVDTTNIVTALIGVGKGDENGNYVTFKDVTWSKANGDPADKPPGQDWIGDDEAAEQWGLKGQHLFGVFQCDSENGIDLLNKTWEQLKIQSQPNITYEMDVALLEYLAGYEHEKIRLGDTVVVYDKAFSPVILVNARVQSLEISFTNPDNNKATLSNFTQAKTNINAQILALQSKLNKKEMAWDSAKDIANAAQQTAVEAQQTANNASQTAETAQETANTAQQAANTAQQTADNAQQVANNALTTANGKNRAFHQPDEPTGSFAVGDLWFDTSKDNRLSVWDGTQWVPSQFGDMAIANIDAGSITSGTLDADKVTVKNLTAGSIKSLDGLNINDQFIVDENGNVTFKGDLNGASGNFNGEVIATSPVDENGVQYVARLREGRLEIETFVNGVSSGFIKFNSDGINTSPDDALNRMGFTIGADDIWLTPNQGNGGSVIMDGSAQVNGELSTTGNATIGGGLIVAGETSLSSDNVFVDPQKFLTNDVELGNCGVAGINSIGTSGVFAGVWVPFRVRKNYTPTSVNLTTGSHNLSSLAGVQTIDATVNGFWLYLTGQKTDQIYRYWRGTYSA